MNPSPRPDFVERRLAAGGQRLNAVEGPPNGPPLLLLHGVGRRWQDYSPFLAAFAARAHVFALDHRGHGGSDRAARYLVADYVADVLAVVRGLPSPVAVVGHSLGALVALGVAAAAPEMVRAVVLEDPPSAGFLDRLGETSYATQFAAMQSLAGPGRPVGATARALADIRSPGGVRLGDRRDAAALRFLARCLLDLDPAVYTPVLDGRWLDGFDPLAAAANVRCPALLLVADTAEGGMLPATDADALAAALPDAARIDLPGVGHLIHGTQPDRFLRTVMNSLDSL